MNAPNQPYYSLPVGYQPYPTAQYQVAPPSYPCRSVLWFLALIFFGWPIAFILSPFYVFFSPFGPCCDCMRIITDALLLGVQLPCTCVENMLNQVRFC